MKKKAYVILLSFFLLFSEFTFSQNPLFIPDTLSGTTFNISVEKGTKQFFTGINTPTFGYNGAFLGPTLFMNKGDSVTLHVSNNLPDATTVHWHGFHIPAKDDGSPFQPIAAGSIWSPSFKIRNNAGTYWYHPHIHPKSEIQVMKGLAGMIIIRDSVESGFTLPRTYGKDDFPIIVQTRVFDFFHQIATATHEDSISMVNGTINPYLYVPKQVVRFRLLNGSADRTYNFGLSNNANFYVIASDGGLLEQPYATKRLALSVGERAEILVDFTNDSIGQQHYLMSYASELPRGVIGADSVGTSTIIMQEGYYQNPLNGVDFNLLRLHVIAPTPNAVTTVPTAFKPIQPFSISSVNANRSITFNPDTVTSGIQGYVDGPFIFNQQPFDMDSINIITYLNNTEIWTLENKTMVAHPFHIHDIQFFILDINGLPPPPQLKGYKDVVLVKPFEKVRFITKFEHFADASIPYMYHCHLLHHEDDGMMGTFLVLDTTSTTSVPEVEKNFNGLAVYQNFMEDDLIIKTFSKESSSSEIFIVDVLGRKQKEVLKGYLPLGENQFTVNIHNLKRGTYLVVWDNGRISSKKIIR
ncbi:MAG TPA: multicopper oxidase domain-containing protein [Bacteroidia bacterium]|jgi:bilirubin oxidase|nr:multicopper oxidase domain-containing protein [Bacteroidia bacterium]